jgi:hypothetical protein
MHGSALTMLLDIHAKKFIHKTASYRLLDYNSDPDEDKRLSWNKSEMLGF